MIGMTSADSDHEIALLPPYKLAASRARGGEPSVIDIGDRRIGGEHFALIAGPCTAEAKAVTGLMQNYALLSEVGRTRCPVMISAACRTRSRSC